MNNPRIITELQRVEKKTSGIARVKQQLEDDYYQ